MACVVCSRAPARFGDAADEDTADFLTLSDGDRKAAEGRVGRAGVLVVESTYNAAAQFDTLREALADALRGVDTGNVAVASMNVSRVFRQFAESSDIGDAIFVPLIMADMAGQLMVQGREAQRVELGAIGAGQDPRAFLNLPWPEAIEEFKRRGLLSEDEFARMLQTYAQRSVEARRAMLERLQTLMRQLLVTAVEEGQTFREFAASVEDGTAPLGISKQDPSYLQTVFRTNVQSAYGAGRFRAMTDPDVMEARPFVQYRTVGDARVRPAHAKLHNLVFRINNPEWHRIAPPNGFNCRCSAVTLDREQAKGLRIVRKVPRGGEPDPEFDGPPVAMLEQPIT